MDSRKRGMRAFSLLIALYLAGCTLSVLPAGTAFPLRELPSFYFLALGIVLCLYFSRAIIDARVRRCLMAVAALIVFWLFIRIEKYAAFEESEFAVRMLWYAYYIPCLLIPQFSFVAALAVETAPDGKLPRIHRIAGVVSVILVALVLTNDFHQLVFGLEPGFTHANSSYTHEPLYWIIAAWDYLFLFLITFALYRSSRLPGSRRLAGIAIAYVTIFAIWMLLTAFDLRPKIGGENFGEFPETACFAFGGFWVLSMALGLVPSNRGYGKLLSVTGLAAQIADADLRVVYRSPSARTMTAAQMADAGPVMLDADTRVYRKEVRGGFAYWQVDIGELNRLNAKLEDTREALAEEAELQRRENALKERQAKAETRLKLYDDIAEAVLPQLRAIEQLAKAAGGGYGTTGAGAASEAAVRAEAAVPAGAVNAEAAVPAAPAGAGAKADLDTALHLVCIHAAYVKRMSNLMLLAASCDTLSRAELRLALHESARYLGKAGIAAQVDADKTDCAIRARDAIGAYRTFQALLETVLPGLQGMHAVFAGTTLKLTFEGGGRAFCTDAIPAMPNAEYEVDGDVVFAQIRLSAASGHPGRPRVTEAKREAPDSADTSKSRRAEDDATGAHEGGERA